jgi:hypothetical protein
MREILEGVPEGEPSELVARMGRRVTDVYYVSLEAISDEERNAFLKWLVDLVEHRDWRSLLIEVEKGRPIANGMTTDGEVHSFGWPVWS